MKRRRAASLASRLRLVCLGAVCASSAALAAPARAQVSARISVDQRGDFVLFGNTLAQNCRPGVDTPVVGSVGACGDDAGDTGADVFWSADVADQSAVASTAIDLEEASSVAVLTLPAGAVVTHARLYWSALDGGGDTSRATLARPGVASEAVAASVTTSLIAGGDGFYQSSADVTAFVRARGAGPYQLSGIDAGDIIDVDSEVHYAGWWMVVFYELASEPLRNLTLFDGFELVSEDDDQRDVTLAGFEVPAGGFDAKLAVVAYEGDASIDGDELRFGPDEPLGPGDALLDSGNFFDSSRLSATGAAQSIPGDLPQLSGESDSMSGLDFDVVDVTDRVVPGQTSAAISAITDFDTYLLAGFVTSVTTFRPDLTQSVKTVIDVNGAPLRPGDELEYTVTVSNVGTDAALEVLLLDVLPAAVSFVPGSLAIISGAGAGALTDAADADRGELDASGAPTLVVRLGDGADGNLGGRLDIGESSVVRYRVSVGAAASGDIENQAEISAIGELGGESSVTPTDGNLTGPGAPPTEIAVDACGVAADCAGLTPHCDPDASPRRCVECLLDAHCPGLQPRCDAGRECTCVAASAETSCDGKDDDCDGQIDEGFVGQPCTLGTGACAASGVTICDTTSTTRCGATPGAPGIEACSGGSDEDCDGLVDVGDPDCSDQDADGIADGVELTLGTNPADADSDDDGVADGAEPSFDLDTDSDGLINALDGDSDNDALRDGTELGLGCSGPGTRAVRCVADADDGETVTNPLVADTDGGGMTDGSEDFNLDGVQDEGESNPSAGRSADDGAQRDADNDGVSDALERFLGAAPRDADTDDDGLSDGLEPNPSIDADEDGFTSSLDPDSDNDGLFDGTETGHACDDPATLADAALPPSLVTCRVDADPSTRTSALAPDSDRGGVSDGREDANGDGVVDGAETDPLDGADDDPSASCDADDDCGEPEGGRVCTLGSCVQGCRADEPASCPAGYACETTSGDLGRCTSGETPGGADGGSGPSSGSDAGDVPNAGRLPPDEIGASLGGGGCACRVSAAPVGGCAARAPMTEGSTRGRWAALGLAAALVLRRRARRAVRYSSSVR